MALMVIFTLFSIFVLVVLHELGHFLSAKLMKLDVVKIGIKKFPIPSFYISIKQPKSRLKIAIFILSGTFTTLLLTVIIYYLFRDIKPLMIATVIVLLGNTNPFYSDISIILYNIILYQKEGIFINFTTEFTYKTRLVYRSPIFIYGFFLWAVIAIYILLKTIKILLL